MNALEREYRDDVERARLREWRRNGLLLAIPTTLATIILACCCWDNLLVATAASFTIVHWFAYATTRSRLVVAMDPEPSEEAQPERGYRTPMFTLTPASAPHRTIAERLGRRVGAWCNRRDMQRMVAWERRLEEKG